MRWGGQGCLWEVEVQICLSSGASRSKEEGGEVWVKKTWLVFFLVLLLVVGVYIKNQPWWQAYDPFLEPVRIGFVGPWTGPYAGSSLTMREGGELAVENMNRNGGINGRQVLLIEKDDEGDPEKCRKAVSELILEDKVAAIVGPYNSQNCLAIMDLVEENKVALITPIAMTDEISIQDDYIFRNTLGIKEDYEKFNAYVSLRNEEYMLLDSINYQDLGILWQHDLWGQEMTQCVLEMMQNLGKEKALLFCEPYQLGQTDFSQLLGETLCSKHPDVIHLVGQIDESIRIVRQAREMGYQGLFVGAAGFKMPEFDKALGEIADGCLFTSQWHPSFSTPMSDVFVKLYSEKYPQKTPDMFAAFTYEAMYILKNAMQNAGNSYTDISKWRASIRDRLAETKNFYGMSGRISFDRFGQCDRPNFMLQKRWDGHKITAVIVFPRQYAQDQIRWDFQFSG
jgi:branched-chain amino acid transport system substrate-binding protein